PAACPLPSRIIASPPRSLLVFLIFLLSASVDPRVLSSFPTRRSSDLPALAFYYISFFHSKTRVNDIIDLRRYTLKQISYFNVYLDRKSTRLNSSHVSISYALFCLKKKHDTP